VLELLLAAPAWRANGSDTAAMAAAATLWGATLWGATPYIATATP